MRMHNDPKSIAKIQYRSNQLDIDIVNSCVSANKNELPAHTNLNKKKIN